MAFIGRKTLKSERARMHQINAFFLHTAEVLLACYALFLVGAYLSERTLWRITETSVSGAFAAPSEEIATVASSALSDRLLYSIRRDNVLLYPRDRVLREIRGLSSRIAHAEISFPTRTHLHVGVTEYTPNYRYCRSEEFALLADQVNPTVVLSSDASSTQVASEVQEAPLHSGDPVLRDCFFADTKGYVFSASPEYSGHPFLTVIAPTSTPIGVALSSPIGTQMIPREEQEQIERFIAHLRAFSLETHTVILYPEGDVEFRSDMPWSILWSVTEDPAESAKNLGVVLESLWRGASFQDELHRIDLRFGNKIFYQ